MVIHYNLPEETPANLFTVSASAFQPAWDGYSYTNIGHRLIHTNTGGDPINGDTIAPVQLPSGVSITKISFFWGNSQAEASGRAWLYRGDLDGGHTAMMNSSCRPLTPLPESD